MIRTMIVDTNDTIAAICTGMTGSGINVIRVSGNKSFKIGEQIFKSAGGKSFSDMGKFSLNYGYIVDKSIYDENTIDEVLLLKMQAPHSYTKEDVIEIDCHGGILVTKKILELVLKNGARIAEPGEFTKRAFLNGRIDLSQAEAVIDIINSKSNLALKNSVRQLKGQIREKIVTLRETLLSKTAYIEAALDDPEHISLEGFNSSFSKDICYIDTEIEKLIDSSDDGRLINEGINTCILGLPNAGKSSLLNALLEEDRAIVTDIAGTTRDILKETICFDNIILNIFDTAGIRNTDDIIERIGVDKARKEAENADLILYVIDMNEGLKEDDKKIIEELRDKKIIIVYNKSDLLSDNTGKSKNSDPDINIDGNSVNNKSIVEYVTISSITGEGLTELKNKIKKLFYEGRVENSEDIIITNERHRELLINARKSIKNVMDGFNNGISEDFLTIDLMDAYENLGKIIGESIEDDLADKIFKDFCMGK